jgi:hypothetical protein
LWEIKLRFSLNPTPGFRVQGYQVADRDARATAARCTFPHAPAQEGESLLKLRRRTVNLRRPERARNEGSTESKRLDDTRCTTFRRRSGQWTWKLSGVWQCMHDSFARVSVNLSLSPPLSLSLSLSLSLFLSLRSIQGHPPLGTGLPFSRRWGCSHLRFLSFGTLNV